MLIAAGSKVSENVYVESYRNGAWTRQPDFPHESGHISQYSVITIGSELWYFGTYQTTYSLDYSSIPVYGKLNF